MSETAITTSVAKSSSLPLDSRSPHTQPVKQIGLVRRALQPLASLRLTVWLFALSIVLVFLGTLAQMDEGIFIVLGKYFRSYIAWIPMQVFVRFGQVFFGVSPTATIGGSFPYPGGWSLGTLLLINLLAAHAVRFKLTWKRSGILILHSGLVILMVSEWVAGTFQVEGSMTIRNGSSSSYVESHDKTELVFIDPSDPREDAVVAIPEALLRKKEQPIHNDLLPVDVVVNDYWVNSQEPRSPRPGEVNPANAGDGLQMVADPAPPVSGTNPEQKVDFASAYITLMDKETGKPLGKYLVSVWLSALSDRPFQFVTIGGKPYKMALRFHRTYKPYTLHLIEFRHDKYIGTDTPRNYSSLVRLVDPEQNEDREVLIRMNEPLVYRGEKFFQSSFLPGDQGTILQVVDNPGRLMPYISCTMISVGMLLHFLLTLVGFFQKLALRGVV